MRTLAELTAAPAVAYVPEEYQYKLARRWADVEGYQGFQGGWIYRVRDGSVIIPPHRIKRPVVQGWLNFFRLFRTQILDELTRELTAFNAFAELTAPASATYRPTLLVLSPKDWRYDALAGAYDEAMKAKGDARRAHRGKGRDVVAAPERPRSPWLGFVVAGVAGRGGY